MKILPIIPQKARNIVKGALVSTAMLGMFVWANIEDAKDEARRAKDREEMSIKEAFYIRHTEFPLGDTKEEEFETYKEDILPYRMDEAKERDSIKTQDYLNYYNYNTYQDDDYAKRLKKYMTNAHNVVEYWKDQFEAVKRLEENKYTHPGYRAADSVFVRQQIENEKKEMAESFMSSYNPYE